MVVASHWRHFKQIHGKIVSLGIFHGIICQFEENRLSLHFLQIYGKICQTDNIGKICQFGIISKHIQSVERHFEAN